MMLGMRMVGLLLIGCGALLLGFAQHRGLVQLLTEAFPVWRSIADTDAQRQQIVRSQMRITACVLLLLGGIALLT